MSTNTSDDESTDKYRERDCPLCGSETTVDRRTHNRLCNSCGWEVHVGGPSEKGEQQRIHDLEEKVERLEERLSELERSDSGGVSDDE